MRAFIGRADVQEALVAPPPWDPYVDVVLRVGAPDPDNEGLRPLDLEVPGELRVLEHVKLDALALRRLIHEPDRYGRSLGEIIWTGEVAALLDELLGRGESQSAGLRLWLDVPLEARAFLYWERLSYPEGGQWSPVAKSQRILLSRRALWRDGAEARPERPRRARALAVIASPKASPHNPLKDSDPLAIPQREREALRAALTEFEDVTVLESGTARRPTMKNLLTALQEGPEVLHVLAHGKLTPAGPVLILEDEAGVESNLTTDALIQMLNSISSPPRLCVFAACESADGEHTLERLSLGERVVRDSGVAAAVAMSGKVGVEAAAEFTSAFYRRLLAHGFVDLAVQEARAYLLQSADWSAPVLFSCLHDNSLLDRSQQEIKSALGWVGLASSAAQHIKELNLHDSAGEALVRDLFDFDDALSALRRFPLAWSGILRDVLKAPEGLDERLSRARIELDSYTLGAAAATFEAMTRGWARVRSRLVEAMPLDSLSIADQAMGSIMEAEALFRDVIPQLHAELELTLTEMESLSDAGQAMVAFERGNELMVKFGELLKAWQGGTARGRQQEAIAELGEEVDAAGQD